MKGNKVGRAGAVRFRRGSGSALYGGGGGKRWAVAAPAVVTRRLALPRALPLPLPSPGPRLPFPPPLPSLAFSPALGSRRDPGKLTRP